MVCHGMGMGMGTGVPRVHLPKHTQAGIWLCGYPPRSIYTAVGLGVGVSCSMQQVEVVLGSSDNRPHVRKVVGVDN